jgi:hypothetical protein
MKPRDAARPRKRAGESRDALRGILRASPWLLRANVKVIDGSIGHERLDRVYMRDSGKCRCPAAFRADIVALSFAVA